MTNIISLILIIGSVALFVGFADPAYLQIKELQAKSKEYDLAMENAAKLASERERVNKQYNSISKEDLDKLKILLPDNIDNIRLIIDIDEMGKKFGMKIRGFNADPQADASPVIGGSQTNYGILNLSFSTTASYRTFLAFLNDLEKSLRILDVNDISFSASEKGDVYDFSVSLKTYWLK